MLTTDNLFVYPTTPISRKLCYDVKGGRTEYMRVSDDMLRCVAFIGHGTNDSNAMEVKGTVFFVARQSVNEGYSFVYAVTAKHIIQGIENKGLDRVMIRFNGWQGGSYGVVVGVHQWIGHPEETEVDVAVLPLTFGLTRYDLIALPLTAFIDEETMEKQDVGVGDDVFLSGLFSNRSGKERNLPIIRRGCIAAMPDPAEKIKTRMGFIEAYLVEVRSLGGMSGAPVFVDLGVARYVDGQIWYTKAPHTPCRLMGLMHGHYDMDATAADEISEPEKKREVINKGIAIIVPSEKILEVLNQPMLKDAEKKAVERADAKRLPTMDSLEDELLTQDAFEEALRRASRKTSSQPESESETP